MTTPVEELKIRARLALKAQRTERPALRLGDCLNEVSRAVGFAHWEQARRVLGGQARVGEDMGSFWHAPDCQHTLNTWFADYASARDRLAQAGEGGDAVLLPYRRQFVLAQPGYIAALGLAPDDAMWTALGRDLVAGYGTPAWQGLAMARLAGRFAPPRRRPISGG